jgi:hypothetical protein
MKGLSISRGAVKLEARKERLEERAERAEQRVNKFFDRFEEHGNTRALLGGLPQLGAAAYHVPFMGYHLAIAAKNKLGAVADEIFHS